MYTITCDGKTLHDPRLGEGYVVLDSSLTLEINKAGLLEFSVAPTNNCYEDIVSLKNRINVYRDDVCIWEGRTLNVETPFNLIKRVTCEGRIAELKDCMFTTDPILVSQGARPTAPSIPGETFDLADGNLPVGFQRFFARFNAYLNDTSKEMTLGSMDIPFYMLATGEAWGDFQYELSTDDGSKTFYDLLYNGETSEDTEEISYYYYNFIPITQPPYNAHVIPRYRGEDLLIVDILQDPGELSTQKIEFGKNLLDLTQYIDPEQAYSIIYPMFYQEGFDYMPHYLDGSFYSVDQTTHELTNRTIESPTLINLIGRVMKGVKITFTDYDEELGTQAKRTAKATEVLENALNDILTIELKALDISLLGISEDEIKLYNYYEIVSAPHQFDEIYQCTGVSLDLDEPQNNVYTFGASRQTLTNWVTEAIKAAGQKTYSTAEEPTT